MRWQRRWQLLVVDIGQESAYSCKLQELPTGTSQWSSSLCTSKGSTHNHKICVSEKQYPKEVFLLRNLPRNIPNQSTGVSQQRIPTDGFFSETFWRQIFCWQLQKAAVMELLPNYHQSHQRAQNVAHPLIC